MYRSLSRRLISILAASLPALSVGLSLPSRSAAAPARARPVPKVYIGTIHGWSDLIAHPNQWRYVRAHADGFYANFIQLLPTVGDPGTLCKQTAPLMAHKNAYFESDSRDTGLGGFPNGGHFTLDTEAQEINELLYAGFTVTYSSLNYGVGDAKLRQCRTLGLLPGTTRPCLAQNGPWLFGGDIHRNIQNNVGVRRDIAHTAGESTDGPLALWAANQGQMQQGSVSVVKYARHTHRLSMVMISPGDLPAARWLSTAEQCVRYHEDRGATPDIWADYAYDTQTPTVPESTPDGKPANTVTGAAYWLIHHLTDPAHWARLTIPTKTLNTRLCAITHTSMLPADVRAVWANAGTTPVEATEAELSVPVTRTTHGHPLATRVLELMLHNESGWLDLCPVLCAEIADPSHHWTVGFRLGGRDITRAVVREGGFVFVRDQRLWPNARKRLQLVLTDNHPSASDAAGYPVTVRITLLANAARRNQRTETLTIHGFAVDQFTGL